MEQLKNGEQPNQNDDVQVTEVTSEQGIPSSDGNGSLGKFKDAKSLLSAYNNLQAEFTKKCQKLSELEKNNQEINRQQPIFQQEDWNDKVSDFLNKNQDAKNYASEISSIIISNPELMKKDDALELAWAKIVQQKYVVPEKVVDDEEFVNKYILSNPSLQQKILDKYVKQIQTSNPPPVISTTSGGNIAFASKKSPLSLSEAKTLVEEIFNAKGD